MARTTGSNHTLEREIGLRIIEEVENIENLVALAESWGAPPPRPPQYMTVLEKYQFVISMLSRMELLADSRRED